MIEINDENCYVAFLDILGFKEIVLKEKADKVDEIFKILIQAKREVIEELKEKNQKYYALASETIIRVMSDSIVIAVKKEIENSFDFLCRCCMFFQWRLGGKKYFIRGGIALGKVTSYDEVIFGKGLVDAYKLESEVARYPRIIVSLNIDEVYSYDNSTYNHFIHFNKNENLYYLNFILEKDYESYMDYFDKKIKFFEDNIRIQEKYVWMKNNTECITEKK